MISSSNLACLKKLHRLLPEELHVEIFFKVFPALMLRMSFLVDSFICSSLHLSQVAFKVARNVSGPQAVSGALGFAGRFDDLVFLLLAFLILVTALAHGLHSSLFIGTISSQSTEPKNTVTSK